MIYSKQNAERLEVKEITKETYKEIKEDIKNSSFINEKCKVSITCDNCIYCKYVNECDDSEVDHKELRGLRAKIATIDDVLEDKSE